MYLVISLYVHLAVVFSFPVTLTDGTDIFPGGQMNSFNVPDHKRLATLVIVTFTADEAAARESHNITVNYGACDFVASWNK